MRLLGDEYIKSEYRAHRNVENPMHIVGFTSVLAMTRCYKVDLTADDADRLAS